MSQSQDHSRSQSFDPFGQRLTKNIETLGTIMSQDAIWSNMANSKPQVSFTWTKLSYEPNEVSGQKIWTPIF